MTKLQDHPLAELFPLMTDAELAELAADIGANGLRDNIWLCEGKILDGRNRYRACLIAGVEPRTQVYRGDDELGFVVSKNLHRRHLTESQRGMVGARLANLRDPNSNTGKADAEAAEAVSVGTRTVQSARAVLANGVPELAAAVDAGDVKVSAAEKVAKLPKARQRAAVKAGPKAVKEAAKAAAETNGKPHADDEPPAAEVDPADEFTAVLSKLCHDLDAIGQRIVALKESPYAFAVHWQSARDHAKNARETLWGGRPNRECPYCKANGEVKPDCRCCRGTGSTTVSSYKAGVAAVGGGD